MSNTRTILIESALVVGVLVTGIAAADAAYAAPMTAQVQSAAPAVDARRNVVIESQIQVERAERETDGTERTKLYDPNSVKVVPGDRLIFTNSYRNSGRTAVTGFVINNPVHKAVTFLGVRETWATVSVDGGKNFGKLDALTVASDSDASEATTRAAQPADVTHIRWKFAEPIAAGASGKLVFRGVVK